MLPVNDPTTIQAWTPGEPWRRLLATLADLFFAIPFSFLAGLAIEQSLLARNSAPLVAVAVLWWAVSLSLIVRFQGSPGKRLLGLRILRLDGKGPGWIDAVNRQILYIAFLGASLLNLGTVLPTVPPGTTPEKLVALVSENPSSWAWAGDAGLALLWASCLLILMRPDRRALYDLWSGTVVVRPVKAVLKPPVP